jgi:hypothetical protein
MIHNIVFLNELCSHLFNFMDLMVLYMNTKEHENCLLLFFECFAELTGQVVDLVSVC